jgi:signal transduction histidine kinase
MGRLFWKFFIFIWLAQMAGMVAVGTTFWFKHRAEDQSRQMMEGAKPPDFSEEDAIHPPPPAGSDGRSLPLDAHRQSFPRPRGPFPVIPLIWTFLASLISAVLLARYFSKPIDHLRDAFDAAANGNLQVRVGDSMGSRRDELADLGQDFDRMADRLNTLMDAQRRLLHDVSHELRSPLARLQAAVGLARQRPEQLETTMDRIEHESGRIDELVGELLTLSRLEAGVLGMEDEEIRVGDLLTDIVEDARFEAKLNQQQVLFEGRCDVVLKGRPELLARAVENVVRNALKHTPPGKRITVVCSVDEQSRILRLDVLDEGTGVAESELSSIFEPFFRGSGAYNTDGHGLGLAIAKRVMRSHGGSIQASNRASGGLCVEMLLPLDTQKI